MAYFSNGTEGELYEHNVCSRCIHYGNDVQEMCPVWLIQLDWNGAEDGSPEDQILESLIPQQGIYQGLCTMFHPAKPEWAEHGKNYQEWLAEKAKPKE